MGLRPSSDGRLARGVTGAGAELQALTVESGSRWSLERVACSDPQEVITFLAVL